jgi:hypothetical protein
MIVNQDWCFGLNYTPISFPANRAMALYTAELFVKSPCLHPVFGPAFTPYPLFQWYPQSKRNFIKSQCEILKLSI